MLVCLERLGYERFSVVSVGGLRGFFRTFGEPIVGQHPHVGLSIFNFIADAQSLQVSCIEVDEEQGSVCISFASSASGSKCPRCQNSSRQIHSRYKRTLSDLPWQGLQIQFVWHSRKFLCANNGCGQKFFNERLPDVAALYARRTAHLKLALRCLAFACGGGEGARLADRIGMTISPDTLLREIRRIEMPIRETPKALGVDDCAFRKGACWIIAKIEACEDIAEVGCKRSGMDGRKNLGSVFMPCADC